MFARARFVSPTVHFYVQGDMVVVDNKKTERYFDRKFTEQIEKCGEIIREVEAIPNHV